MFNKLFKTENNQVDDNSAVITTISDIVETGVFLRGDFTGGSLKVSVSFKNYDDQNLLDDIIKDIIDSLDHCTITDCDKVFNSSKRAYKILFLDNNYKENVHKSLLTTDVVALVIFTKMNLNIDWFSITIESYDGKIKREYSKYDIIGIRKLVEKMSVVERSN